MDRIAQVSGHLKAPAPIAPGASSADVVPPLVRAFLRHEFDAVDPRLEKFMKELANRGGGECWHKRGTFIEHLFQVGRRLPWETFFVPGSDAPPRHIAR